MVSDLLFFYIINYKIILPFFLIFGNIKIFVKLFDYAILERPIVSFAYDYEEYRDLRGLYIDMEKELPNGICRTQDEVISHIKTMDYAEECRKTKTMIKDKYLEYGGDATKICVQKLFEL